MESMDFVSGSIPLHSCGLDQNLLSLTKSENDIIQYHETVENMDGSKEMSLNSLDEVKTLFYKAACVWLAIL